MPSSFPYFHHSIEQEPEPVILATYRAAIVLKLVAIGVAILSGALIVSDFTVPVARWWLPGLFALLLLLLISPWWLLFHPDKRGIIANRLLIISLVLGIVTPNLELIRVTYQSYTELLELPGFKELLDLTLYETNMIHGFGQLFTMIPVILASWRYRFYGLAWSMTLAGICYVAPPFLSAPGSINIPLYIIRGFVLLGVSLILAFTTYFLAESERRERGKLEKANRLLAEQALVIEELAVSSERTRLARELHDTLAHTLSGTAVQLEAVKTLINYDLDTAKSELHEAQSQIKTGLSESRRAIQALRATPVESLGLSPAIQKLATTIAERNQLDLELDLAPFEHVLDTVVEQAIYRIIQEGLGNIERHAAATHISLTGRQTRTAYQWTIQDDGKGFNPEEISKIKISRFGLVGMQERAGLINATLTIQSILGRGTTVELLLPISDR